MSDKISIIPDDTISNKIYFIRNQKVMIDRIWQHFTGLRQGF